MARYRPVSCAGQGHLVVLFAALGRRWVALALGRMPLPWLWALARVSAAVVAVVMAAGAVWMARRFLAVHPASDARCEIIAVVVAGALTPGSVR